jgi:hypothetical protein
MFLEDNRAGVEATAERRRHMGVFPLAVLPMMAGKGTRKRSVSSLPSGLLARWHG